jgi:murein hydrolase activator
VQVAARHRQAAAGITGAVLAEQDRAIAMGEEARDIVDLIGQLNVDASVRARLETLPGPVLRPGDPVGARDLPSDVATPMGNRLPYRLPVAGTVVTGLGEVSDTGVRARGLTLATAPQAQVVAPAGGRIVFSGPFRGFGNVVIIDHGQGWTTMIAGLAARDAQVGDRVIQGGPVGKAGTDRPEVTIELRRNMRPIDISWLLG